MLSSTARGLGHAFIKSEGSSPTQFVDHGLAISQPVPTPFGPLAPVALQGGKALNLQLAAQSLANDLAFRLAQTAGKRLHPLSEVVRERDRQRAAHIEQSTRPP